ncbi:MAG: putative sulfate exporter family transporter [Lentisphaeria bacterium]|nr:putative sulfate exporter family transporter [Lentisphaeria bacterium]
MLKKISFSIVGGAFFLVPAFFPVTRNFAPGLAVLCGILFSIFISNPFREKTSKITSNLLGATIVGMGFGMDLMEVLRAGANGFLYTFAGIVMGIGLAIFLGKKLKVQKNTSYLIGVGTSICGGSAIAAAAPALKAKSHEIAMASAVIFALNAIALWLFPVVGRFLDFNQIQFGYFAALGIHDTSSVVGAAMSYGEEALEVGTTIKLARALWIVPVTVFLSCFIAEKEEGEKEEKRKIKWKVPWFIPGFLLAAAFVTFLPDLFPAAKDMVSFIGTHLKSISKYLMITTLYLIGANLSKEKLKELGLRPVIQGVILWIILSTVWCIAIHTGLVNCVK